MPKRQPISKRVRFEVFKRDGFSCQYCGRGVPDVTLEVDHIIPVADGGENHQDNLITSCFDCNRGKGAVPLSSVPMSLEDRAIEAQERKEQAEAHASFLVDMRNIEEDLAWQVADVLRPESSERGMSRQDLASIKMFNERLGYPKTLEAAYIAADRWPSGTKRFKYFCGVCWNRIREKSEVFGDE